MNARVAFFVMVALTAGAVLVGLFQQNWILGASAAAVMAGTGFVGASMHLRRRDNPSPRLAQSISKLRAIGLIVIGLGTLFGALMLLT